MPAYRLYLLISGAASFATRTAFTLNLIYQATVVGLSPLQLVLAGTVMEAVCFLAQVPTGVIADLYSRRLSVITGYLLMGAGLLVWGLVPSYPAVLIGTVIWSIGVTCADGAEEAWAADEIGEELITRAFLRGGQLSQAGSLVGIVAAAGLARWGLGVPIVAGGVINLAVGGLLVAVMTERNWSPTPTGERTTWHSMGRQIAAGAHAVRRGPMLAGIVAGTVFAGLSSEGFDRLGQPFILRLSGTFPEAPLFAGLTMVAALLTIGATALVGRGLAHARPHTAGTLVAVLNAGAGAAMFTFGLVRWWWAAIVLYLLVQLLRDTAAPVLNVWLVSATDPASRATVYSMQAQADALGQIIGGPPVGLVAQRRSLGAGISAAGLFLLPAAALFAWAARRSPTPSPAPPLPGPVPSLSPAPAQPSPASAQPSPASAQPSPASAQPSPAPAPADISPLD